MTLAALATTWATTSQGQLRIECRTETWQRLVYPAKLFGGSVEIPVDSEAWDQAHDRQQSVTVGGFEVSAYLSDTGSIQLSVSHLVDVHHPAKQGGSKKKTYFKTLYGTVEKDGTITPRTHCVTGADGKLEQQVQVWPSDLSVWVNEEEGWFEAPSGGWGGND